MASIKHARELASLFSDENVFFFSADDKAGVPLGLQVSKNQTAIQMYLKHRVKLLNHDFPIGKSISWPHLFMLHVKKNKDSSVGYNRPTYIAIWSGKHEKSSAVSHIEDFRALASLVEFKEACLKDGILKPLLFVSVDDGMDKAPKNTMT